MELDLNFNLGFNSFSLQLDKLKLFCNLILLHKEYSTLHPKSKSHANEKRHNKLRV